MTKEQENIIRISIKAFYSRFWSILDFETIESEALFIYSWLSEEDNLGEDNKGLKFYLKKRLVDLVRREAIKCKKNIIVSEKLEDYSINSSPIDPDHELDFRIGLNKLSPSAKILVDLIFNDESCIDKFNIQGVIRASKKIGMKRTVCLSAVKEIQAFLRRL